MGTPSSNQYFEAAWTGTDDPANPNLFTAAQIVAGSFDSAAVSTATSKAVSTVNAAAPDSTSISQARSQAVSAATNASIADSKAVSNSSNASVADSKAISVSGSTSIADSKAVSVATATPIVTAIVYSGNISGADSKATSIAIGIPTRSVTNIGTYLANNANYNVKDYGAVGDGLTDDSAAFLACLAAAGNKKVILPAGTYFLTQTLNLKHPVCIEGPSTTEEISLEDYPAILKFADGIVGIFVHRYNTTASSGGVPAMDSPTTTGADGCVLRHLSMRVGAGGAPASGDSFSHGIYVKARCLISDVRIAGFRGNGINIVASVGSGVGATEGAANNWNAVRVRTVNNGGHGLFTDGSDSNAGYAEKVDATSNLGWGFYDSSFLGNTYVACHAATNALGPYKSDDANASSVFLGCYSESDQTGSSIVAPSLVIGGSHGAGFAATTTAPHLDATNNIARWSAGIRSVLTAAGRTITATVGGDATNGDFLLLTDSVNGANSWRLKMNGADIDWNYSNSGSLSPFKITGPATLNQFGRSSIFPHGFLTDKLLLGSGGSGRRLTSGTAAPVAGDYAIGDVYFNISSAIGGIDFWKCVTAGTPGTWVANKSAGTFTCAAASSTVVSNINVTATSRIFITPTNAAALTLQAGTNLIGVTTKSASTSFTVTTAGGGSAAGTETFDYVILN